MLLIITISNLRGNALLLSKMNSAAASSGVLNLKFPRRFAFGIIRPTTSSSSRFIGIPAAWVSLKNTRLLTIIGIFLIIVFCPIYFTEKFCFAAVESIDWSVLVNRLIADGSDEKEIRKLFAHPDIKFDQTIMAGKLKELINNHKNNTVGRERAIKALHKSYLKPAVIARARSFMTDNKQELQKIKSVYCVPAEIVVSIVLVETRLGKFMGGRKAFNALASMSLMSDLNLVRPYLDKGLLTPENEEFAAAKCREKSERAYLELKGLLKYAALNNADPLSIPGSVYGAIGICQFLPSNVFIYGVDADKDGRIDLFTRNDALHSVASYLRGNGWQCAMTRAKQKEVILTYNNSHIYANTVLGVADKLKTQKKSARKSG
jgi:membrane-bound lytic murein transglycosylase B